MTDKSKQKQDQQPAETKNPVKNENPAVAKAGKRSSKSLAEARAKQAKKARLLENKEDTNTPIPKPKQTRSLLERRSKSYRDIYKLIDKSKTYELKEASQLISKTNPVKFDATVELHVHLNVDPKQSDQNIRDSVLLPEGSGKEVRVAVFVSGDDAKTAVDAGADLVGENEVIKELEAGSYSFDILISTPSQMPKLGKYARALGPRGLMPNPKSGSVTNDIAKAVSEAKSGRVEYRVDSGGNLHIPIGKVSFAPTKILNNLTAVLNSIKSNKPASVKSTYVLSAYLSTSMGPSIRLAL
jgi:large subunit ribosomal protein L1